MNMTDQSKAHFLVVSDKISPDDICKRLGIKCDEAIWKGTPNPSREPDCHPFNIVIFRSRIDDSYELEKHVADILFRVMPVKGRIKRLPKSCTVSLNFNYRMGWHGGWNFTPAIFSDLAKLAVPCVFSLEARRKGK